MFKELITQAVGLEAYKWKQTHNALGDLRDSLDDSSKPLNYFLRKKTLGLFYAGYEILFPSLGRIGARFANIDIYLGLGLVVSDLLLFAGELTAGMYINQNTNSILKGAALTVILKTVHNTAFHAIINKAHRHYVNSIWDNKID